MDRFSYTDIDSYEPVTEENRMEQVSRKMNELAGAELVIRLASRYDFFGPDEDALHWTGQCLF